MGRVNPGRVPLAAVVLDRAGVSYRLHHHPPVRTEADLHLTGLDVETSAKTLAFCLPDDRLVLAAIPGPARLRYGNLARVLGVSRSALRPAAADRLAALGMEPGGVGPVCDDPRVQLVLDARLSGTLYCGSGLPEVSVELAAADLVRVSPALLVGDLCDDDVKSTG
jgi:Cys-tRNA(Pro)/Cys-tRNA(Cys) deacylase